MKFSLKNVAIAVILIVLGLFGAKAFWGNGDYILKEVKNETLKQVVDVSGKIIPIEDADLSFEVAGKVVRNYFGVGDNVKRGSIIAELDKARLLSDIAKAEADLEVSSLEVDSLDSSDGSNRTDNEKKNAVSVLKNAYLASDLAIRNKTDQILEDPELSYPKATIAINNYYLRQRIGSSRASITKLLKEWKILVDNMTYLSVSSTDIDQTLENLNKVSDYLLLLDTGISDATPAGDISETDLNTFRTNIASARDSVSSYLDSVTALNETLRDVISDLPIKKAQYSSKLAILNSLKAQIDDYYIKAPFDGIVTANDLTVGQTVSANEVVVSIITESDLEVEAFVPEISIANVKVGDPVEFSLDAFGDQKFEGFVASIDPSETIDDGVSTYRVLIGIKESDVSSMIKSGMTADISIATLSRENVLLVPVSSVFKESGKSYVYVKNGRDVERKEVEEGQRDTFGNVEIFKGLVEGDKVILNFEE